MIARHDFNSDWLGVEAGIVADDAFFEATEHEQARLLEPWAWVEARGSLEQTHIARVARAGFLQVDTQVHFRIGLTRIVSTPSVDRLGVRFADEGAMEIPGEELADFRYERFAALHGVDIQSLNRRYALWSRTLIKNEPDVCMEVLADGIVQGWFLGRRSGRKLGLTLAMLRRDARISGHEFYSRALLAYRDRGARVGSASFSISNTVVHNIYAALGARFVAPVGCWLWQRHSETV